MWDIKPTGKFNMGRIDAIIIDSDPYSGSIDPLFPYLLDANHIVDPFLSTVFGIIVEIIIIIWRGRR